MGREIEAAVVVGDIATVRKAIPFHLDSQPDLDRGLLGAVLFSRPVIVDLLLRAGADPNVRDGERKREHIPRSDPMPPGFALEAQRVIDEARAQMSEYDHYDEYLTWAWDSKGVGEDRTVLIRACEGALALFEESQEGFGRATHIQQARWREAAQSARLSIIDKLIAAGADVDARDAAGRTPLIAATNPDTLGTLVLSFEGTEDILGSLDPRPVVARLLAAGADVNGCDSFGNTALIGCRNADDEVLRMLLASGAELDAQNRHGYTALLSCASSVNAVRVRELLAAGARVDICDANGFTALHYAIHRANSANNVIAATEIVGMLLEAGSDLGVRAVKGRTPLHIAAGSNAPLDIVRSLLDADARLDVKDELGMTPLELAIAEGNGSFAALVDRGG